MRCQCLNRFINLFLILHLLYISPSLFHCPILLFHKLRHHLNRQIFHQTIQRRSNQSISTLKHDRPCLLPLIQLLRQPPTPRHILHKNRRLPNPVTSLKPSIPPMPITHRQQLMHLIRQIRLLQMPSQMPKNIQILDRQLIPTAKLSIPL